MNDVTKMVILGLLGASTIEASFVEPDSLFATDGVEFHSELYDNHAHHHEGDSQIPSPNLWSHTVVSSSGNFGGYRS